MRVLHVFLAILAVLLLATACGGAAPTARPTAGLPPTAPAQATNPPAQPTNPPAQPTNPPAQPTNPPAQPTADGGTATIPPRQIVIEQPAAGATISSPVLVQGRVSVSPFEATLRGRVYDAAGQVVGEGPIMVAAEMGTPGPFSGGLAFSVRAAGPGRVEIAEISAKDGSVVASAAVDVSLLPTTPAGEIEIPARDAAVTLPLHILARVGRPGETVQAALVWNEGTVLTNDLPVLAGEDGGGLVLDSIDWLREGPPPTLDTQPARLEIRSQADELLAAQVVTVLSPQDPNVQQVTVYYVLGETVQGIPRNVPRTEAIGTAALNELLWGPPPNNLAGFETAIPTPQEVLAFPGRGPDWGPRVTLRRLTIVDGVATADFSREMAAYAGGSLRIKLLREQITQTLLQFPTVQQVVIAVEGQTEGVLEP